MKTQVLMKRELFGSEVLQQSKTEFFSATDLVKAANEQRRIERKPDFNFSAWLHTKNTTDFITELEKEYGNVITRSTGKGSSTWVHPFLFIDLALSISPKLKIEAYKWLHDHLIQNRNASGDSYRLMAGALFAHQGNKKDFHTFISKTAKQIQAKCRVTNWQAATEDQLAKRDRIHHDISLLANVLTNNSEAVRLAMLQH